MNFFIKKHTLLFLIISSLSIFSCKQKGPTDDIIKIPDRLKTILEKKTISVVTINNSINYFIYRGEPLGFQYELAKAFAEELGVKLKITTKKSTFEVLETVNSGDYDLGATDITKTLKRNNLYNLTTPYSQTHQALIQRKTPNIIKSHLALAGKTVYVVKGSSFEERVNALSDEIGDSILVKTIPDIDQEQAIKMVVDGEIELTIADKNIAKVNKLYYPNLDINTAISFPQYLCWSVPPTSDSLYNAVNSWMKKFRKTRKFKIIYNKYFDSYRSKKIINSDFFSEGKGKISRYDDIIKKQSERIGWDWRLLSSLIYQESRFKPYAVSWAGAKGLMQLMPRTAREYGIDSSSNVYDNINAGIQYIKFLNREVDKLLSDKTDKIKFILAAYNAGIGHLEDAIMLAKKYGRNPNIWDDNVAYFIEMKSTKKYYTDPIVKYGYCRGQETTQYVSIILERFEHYKNLIKD